MFLEGIVVEDPVIGLDETVDLAPGESETFATTVTADSSSVVGGDRPHRVYLPLVFQGIGSNLAANAPLADDITNTATASTEYALATVTASDTCVTKVHEPTVSKDAQPSFERQFYWEITKTVDDPGPIVLWRGDFAEVEYTITADLADPPFTDKKWAVGGEIRIDNPALGVKVFASLTRLADYIAEHRP